MPMEILSISDLQSLVIAGETNWKQYGEVNAVYYAGMVLFNYTQTAQFANRWNFFECISRGLILDTITGEVIARPFDKFFNLGQRENNTAIVSITEKMDGSLGVLYRHKGEYQIATRGSFTSDQARWATHFLNSIHNLSTLDDDLTLLFEIIYPENRVVVDYEGWRALVLIGARSRSTGRELSHKELKLMGLRFSFPVVTEYGFPDLTLLLAAAKVLSANEEGWVVRFADGERLKVKGDAYKLAHRILTGVNFNRVLEAVRDGIYDQMIEGVPDEFLGQIKDWKEEIDIKVDVLTYSVERTLKGAPDGTQKDFALWVQANFNKEMQSYLFAAKAGKDITPLIYRKAFEHREDADRVVVKAED